MLEGLNKNRSRLRNRLLSGDGNAPPPATPSGPFPIPRPGTRRRRWIGAVVSIVIIIVVSITVNLTLNYVNNPPINTANKSTFQEFGITIQYPSGAKMNLQGLTRQTPDTGQGKVDWAWNNHNTALGVAWFNTSGYNYASGFAGIFSSLRQNATSASEIANGTIQMGGQTWQYESFQALVSGTTIYVTYALDFRQAENRLYILSFVDLTNTTLSSLETWGSTLQG